MDNNAKHLINYNNNEMKKGRDNQACRKEVRNKEKNYIK
jgi:hypothetical protein